MTEPTRGGLPPKLYFRIGEVAGLVGVEPHVLRYWEREFRSIRPSKSSKGQRVYSRRDVENLMRVRELLYGRGFTIAGAKRQLREKGLEPALPDDAPGEPLGEVESSPLPSGMGPLQSAMAPLQSAMAPGIDSHARVRRELETLKAEVEDFLRELSSDA